MPFEASCEECGQRYTAKSKRSKFCKAACRVKANRRPDKVGQAKAAGEVKQLVDVVGTHVLLEQVRKKLEAAQALDTISGAAALRVARQLDKGVDSGSAVATLSKELSRLVAEAKAEVAPHLKDGVSGIEDVVAGKLLRLAQ